MMRLGVLCAYIESDNSDGKPLYTNHGIVHTHGPTASDTQRLVHTLLFELLCMGKMCLHTHTHTHTHTLAITLRDLSIDFLSPDMCRFPNKMVLGRTHIKDVAAKRKRELNSYVHNLMRSSTEVTQVGTRHRGPF